MTTATILPELDDYLTVPAEQIAGYREHGHAIVRGVASAGECDAYLPVIRDALERYKKETLPLEQRDTYHKAFIQVANLWELDEKVKKFVFAKRFAKIAADLMGVDGVRLYHDQALFKEPGGGPTPWHQDQFYWPIDSSKTITMWLALVPAPIETGSLVFASGVQEKGALAQLHISEASTEFYSRYVRENEVPLIVNELGAGDATWHSGWTPHKAAGNTTGRMRAAMTVIYYADGVKISEPANEYQPKDLERWFPGQKPGEVAASPLNPLLYHRSWDKK